MKHTTFRAAALLALAAIAVTGCGLKKRYRCTATATYAGQPVRGRGSDFDDEATARKYAQDDLCSEYCNDRDPAVDAAVKLKLGRAPKDITERLSAVHNPPVLTVYDACRAACKAAAGPVTMTCEHSGI